MLLACELLLADVARSDDPDREWKTGVLQRLRRSLVMGGYPEVGATESASSPGQPPEPPGSAEEAPSARTRGRSD